MYGHPLLPSNLAEAGERGMSAYRAALIRAAEEELRRYNERCRRQAERDWGLVVDATARLKQLATTESWLDQYGLASEDTAKTHQPAA